MNKKKKKIDFSKCNEKDADASNAYCFIKFGTEGRFVEQIECFIYFNCHFISPAVCDGLCPSDRLRQSVGKEVDFNRFVKRLMTIYYEFTKNEKWMKKWNL